jgi:electron transport complex protein RnfG
MTTKTDNLKPLINCLYQQSQIARAKLAIWLEADNLKQLHPNISYQTGILAGFALVSALLLGLADLSTRGVIQTRLEEDLKANLEEVIPAALYDNNLLNSTIQLDSSNANLGAAVTQVYLATKQGQLSAICFKFVAPDGYAGPITLVMGIAKDGEILGIRIISHTETPGLGDKIEISKSTWVLSFEGKSLNNLSFEEWHVKKDGGVFDQFAGATITPRKVVQAIKRGLQFYQSNQDQLIAAARLHQP